MNLSLWQRKRLPQKSNRMKWNRAMGWIGIAAVLCFAACLMTSLPNIAGHRLEVRDNLSPADAIVVLGAGMMADGSLNDQSMRRLLHGLLLYKDGYAPLIVFTGPREHG